MIQVNMIFRSSSFCPSVNIFPVDFPVLDAVRKFWVVIMAMDAIGALDLYCLELDSKKFQF